MSVVDEIKAKLDILTIIQDAGVPLKRAGRVWKACCPFHQERTPSFAVYPESGTWRCFGACAEGGDIFSFVMKRQNIDFKEAVTELAGRAGVELKPSDAALEKKREQLINLNSVAAEFYHDALRYHLPLARGYLIEQRGINPETIRKWRLGYSLEKWDALAQYLLARGFDKATLLESGLVRQANGKLYDFFRDRLMIPILDARGNVVSFAGRTLTDLRIDDRPIARLTDDRAMGAPKYMNGSETLLFKKNRILFGLHLAKNEIRTADRAVVVEGYFDVIGLWQAGVPNAVAPMGTALGETQIEELVRYTDHIYLCQDADRAGEAAALRDILPLLTAGGRTINLRIMTLPSGKDPDEVVLEDKTTWDNAVSAASPALEWAVAQLTRALTPNAPADEREAAARAALPIIQAAPTAALRAEALRLLSLRTRFAEPILTGWNRAAPASKPPAASTAADLPAEVTLVLNMVIQPTLPGALDKALEKAGIDLLKAIHFADSTAAALFTLLRAYDLLSDEDIPAYMSREADAIGIDFKALVAAVRPLDRLAALFQVLLQREQFLKRQNGLLIGDPDAAEVVSQNNHQMVIIRELMQKMRVKT